MLKIINYEYYEQSLMNAQNSHLLVNAKRNN